MRAIICRPLSPLNSHCPYACRLKQELEEMRHQCTVLLRDKFSLEQCVRCGARGGGGGAFKFLF